MGGSESFVSFSGSEPPLQPTARATTNERNIEMREALEIRMIDPLSVPKMAFALALIMTRSLCDVEKRSPAIKGSYV